MMTDKEKRGAVAIIIGGGPPKGYEKEPSRKDADMADGLEDGARALIKAIEAKDSGKVARAFAAMHAMCR